MSTTITLPYTPLTAVDVSVGFLDQSKLEEIETSSVAGGRISKYVYNDGNPQLPTQVTVRSIVNKDGSLNASITLSTVQVVTVNSDDPIVQPATATFNWQLPGVEYDASILMKLLTSVFSLGFNGVTSKVPNTGIVEAVNRGLTKVY